MDKLPALYTSFKKTEDKTAWVKLIKDNPTVAIDTYYNAFCKDNPNGYCDLFQLFQLLGILKERKAKGEPIVATGSTSDTADQATLGPIYDALIKLGEKIDSKIPSAEEAGVPAEEAAAPAEEAAAEDAALRLAADQARQEAERKATEEQARHEEELRLAQEATEEQAKAAEEERKRLEAVAKAAAEAPAREAEINDAQTQQNEERKEGGETEGEEGEEGEETAALVEDISCDYKKGTINANFEKKLFTLYEEAKDILHSDMLILIGCLHFYKLGKLTISENSDTEEILTELENALFIQLTREEYGKITSELLRIDKTLNETFIKICERDEKYKDQIPETFSAIMVYALLWIFHFNKNIAINDSISTYEQIISNKSLFDKYTLFINDTNCSEIIAIGDKIQKSIAKLKEIKDTIKTQGFIANLVDLKRKYAHILKENKSVLALLKRRDDWVVDVDVAKKHKRFNLDIKGQDTIAEPLQLRYNDTPLVIPGSTLVESQTMTHKYDFYGFDSVYAPKIDNSDIASDLATKFNFKNDIRPLCFIGYGQSGSGKTSTLIYLDVPGKEEDGIIMQLLNQLDPNEVTVSMIEIYEAEAAKASDESCIGIGTVNHSPPGEIVKCYASNTDESKPNDKAPQTVQAGGAVKERIPVTKFKPIPAEIKQGKQPIKPSMRYITIGEVLDKQFDEKGNPRGKNEEKDKQTFTTFKKGSVTCQGTYDSKPGWFYTHNEHGEECMDKNFGLKHYILMGFECREIAPTSNNKQSSRSHVVVSLKLEWGSDMDRDRDRDRDRVSDSDSDRGSDRDSDRDSESKKTRYIYVCDLAGVENEFDCNTPGSADIIRMKAKTKANKNYSNIVGSSEIEDWKKLEEKRAGNIVKYVHKDVHISETEEGPTCWPDGTPNEAGDIDTIRLENSTELLKIFWHITQPGNEKKMDLGPGNGVAHDSLGYKKDVPKTKYFKDKIVKYFENKLKKLPIKKNENGDIIGFVDVKKKIKEFINIKYENIGSSFSFVAFLHGSEKYDKIELGQLTLTKLADQIIKRSSGQSATLTPVLNLLKSVFNPIEMPDCKSSYEAGFKRACDIRTKEGYVINNTLAQLTRDVKRISKYAIKERLENPTGKKETVGTEESPATYPCLFADTYDEYSKYSKSTHPLMNWYDIDDPLKEDFGSILTAMCLISDPDKKTVWDINEKLNLLKTFRFNYCTVLNETFMMRRGGEVAKTPAGNEIYVNNPPLPPYINVGILENSYKEYIFYENDPRTDTDTDKAHIEKKAELFLTLCKHFLNLIVKMFRHPIYENDAIKFMQQLGSISNKPSIIFQIKEEMKNLINNTKVIKFLKLKIEEFINKIKTNNNATFIGTIQTTEQVNRVSDKIVISEALDSEKELNSIDDENINRQLLKRLFHTSNTKKERKTSAILYECLYEIRKLYTEKKLPIASKTMKERDIDGMVSAIETAFPLMSRYLDHTKINNNWNLISHMERGESVMKDKTEDIYGKSKNEYNSYPYSGDNLTQTAGGTPINTNQRKKMNARNREIRNEASNRLRLEKSVTSEPILIHPDFIPTNPKNALSTFNEILINNLKDEPSLEYIKSKEVWEKVKSNKKTKTIFTNEIKIKIKNGDTFRHLTGIKETKISLMQYLVTDDFFAAVYGDYISQTIEKNKWDADNKIFTDFKPVKTADARKHLSQNIYNTYKVQKSYPPENTVQWGGAGEPGEITTDVVFRQINEISGKIENLGGIGQSERDKHTRYEHARDLAKINEAVTELQTHLTELYSGGDSISNKLQEALQQLEDARP